MVKQELEKKIQPHQKFSWLKIHLGSRVYQSRQARSDVSFMTDAHSHEPRVIVASHKKTSLRARTQRRTHSSVVVSELVVVADDVRYLYIDVLL